MITHALKKFRAKVGGAPGQIQVFGAQTDGKGIQFGAWTHTHSTHTDARAQGWGTASSDHVTRVLQMSAASVQSRWYTRSAGSSRFGHVTVTVV